MIITPIIQGGGETYTWNRYQYTPNYALRQGRVGASVTRKLVTGMNLKPVSLYKCTSISNVRDKVKMDDPILIDTYTSHIKDLAIGTSDPDGTYYGIQFSDGDGQLFDQVFYRINSTDTLYFSFLGTKWIPYGGVSYIWSASGCGMAVSSEMSNYVFLNKVTSTNPDAYPEDGPNATNTVWYVKVSSKEEQLVSPLVLRLFNCKKAVLTSFTPASSTRTIRIPHNREIDVKFCIAAIHGMPTVNMNTTSYVTNMMALTPAKLNTSTSLQQASCYILGYEYSKSSSTTNPSAAASSVNYYDLTTPGTSYYYNATTYYVLLMGD